MLEPLVPSSLPGVAKRSYFKKYMIVMRVVKAMEDAHRVGGDVWREREQETRRTRLKGVVDNVVDEARHGLAGSEDEGNTLGGVLWRK